MPKAICVILARGGSKRIPGKNIRLFNGFPMVSWPVKTAVASQIFQEIYISTDSPEIEKTACSSGAQTLGLRPAALSDDFSGTADVLAYFLKTLKVQQGTLPQYFCCLYGTSIFTTIAQLETGFHMIQEGKHDCVLAVTQYKHPIERALTFTKEGCIQYIHPHDAIKRTQDCTITYHDVGMFYWLNTESFMKQENPGFKDLVKTAIIIPEIQAIDIDTEENWALAEHLYRFNQNNYGYKSANATTFTC